MSVKITISQPLKVAANIILQGIYPKKRARIGEKIRHSQNI
jgi:hypothetical protein